MKSRPEKSVATPGKSSGITRYHRIRRPAHEGMIGEDDPRGWKLGRRSSSQLYSFLCSVVGSGKETKSPLTRLSPCSWPRRRRDSWGDSGILQAYHRQLAYPRHAVIRRASSNHDDLKRAAVCPAIAPSASPIRCPVIVVGNNDRHCRVRRDVHCGLRLTAFIEHPGSRESRLKEIVRHNAQLSVRMLAGGTLSFGHPPRSSSSGNTSFPIVTS